jgi:Xaa-Pro dipeptidase
VSAITFNEAAGQQDVLGYARFSDDELARRRQALLELARESAVDGLVLYGAAWSGSAVPWLTEWPTTSEAVVVVTPDEADALLVQHHNHLPQARQLARRCAVSWGGPSTMDGLRAELARRGLQRCRLGWIGTLKQAHASLLASDGVKVVDLSRGYTRLRLVKSTEELDWLRHGARLSDAGLQALLDGLRPGMTEWEIGDLIERGYVAKGGSTVIHHICSTSMNDPDTGVPRQHRSNRRVDAGDAVTVEISAAWWGYSGQVLRTIAVDAEPSPLYAELHEVAERAYESILAALRPGRPRKTWSRRPP